jgi:hypothetical protein
LLGRLTDAVLAPEGEGREQAADISSDQRITTA